MSANKPMLLAGSHIKTAGDRDQRLNSPSAPTGKFSPHYSRRFWFVIYSVHH